MSVTLKYQVTDGISPKLMTCAERAEQLERPHRVIGDLLVGVTRRNMLASGGPVNWPELAPATLLARARGRSGRQKVFVKASKKQKGQQRIMTKRAQAIIAGAKPLIFSKRLFNSLTYLARRDAVLVGSNLVYASRQFLGGGNVPARWPFGLTRGDRQEIRSIYSKWITRGQL
jgi:hypothetical protein